MKAKHLAEAVILQALEDLWDEDQREDCLKFFTGADFRTCAAVAGMDTTEQIKVLNLLDKIMKGMKRPVTGVKSFPEYVVSKRELRELART